MTSFNRDHVRSRSAFQAVSELTGDKEAYGRLALKLPFLIRTAGLAQALTFVDTKARDAGVPLLSHLAATLGQVSGESLSAEALLRRARETSDPAEYLLLTREALKVATWYKRLSTSVLGVVDGDEEGGA